MKKTHLFLTLVIFIFTLGALQAQATHTVDFEPAGVGADWGWTVSDNDDNPPLEFIANPDASGLNTSANVAKFTARLTGNPWALCYTSDDGEFTFDATNSTVTIMVHKPVISDIGFKVEGISGNHQIVVPNTVTDEWEEITFDFSGQIGNTYGTMVIIPDFDMDGREQENIVYFDDIQIPDGEVAPPPTEPTVAAPDPTADEADVMSIYSNVYTDLEDTNFNPSWGQSTIVTVDYLVDGNNTLKYENLNYQGTNLGSVDGGVPQDVSGYDYLHVDFWTPNSTTLDFYVLDQTGGEVFYSLAITTEEWVSVDIPLSHFLDAGEDLTDIHQFKVVGNGTVWFDNWYFWMDTAPSIPEVAAPDPATDESNVMSIYSDVYTDLEGTNFNPSWGQSTIVIVDYLVAGNNTINYENLDFQGTNLGSVDGGVPQDVSEYEYFHLDFWTSNSTSLDFYMLDQTGGEVFYSLAITTEEWVSVDIPLSHFSDAGEDLTDIHQFKVVGNGTVWFDNWYFWMVPADPEPTVAAPVPTNEEVDVVSIYSDTFNDLEGTDFNPWWGQSTIVTFEAIEDNEMMKYDVFNYQGTQLAAAQDVSLMEYVHIDMWTSDATVVLFTPISVTAGEFLYSLTPIEAETWNSYDIPLSAFEGVSMADIHQLKFDGQAGVTPSTIYLDNIYFWKEPTPAGSDATLSDLQVDGETVAGFAPTNLYYNIELPIGTSEVPEVTATTNDPEASLVINDATELPGTTDVVVTAEDDSTMLTYSVEFSFADPVPQVAAPDPTVPEEDVVSIYSDSYTDLAGTNFNPGWGQSTIVSFEEIGGNEMMKYDIFNYQGTELAGSQDLSSMNYVHIDMWTPDATVVLFTPISVSTGELLYSLTPLEAETWNSYDIPLSAFEGVSMTDIFQLKFDGQQGVTPSTIYLDNIYFYSTMTTDPPENLYVDPYTWLFTWAPPGGSIIFEDFDGYNVGEYLAVQSEHWTTWSDDPGSGEDALISDEQALSGTNSVKIDANESVSDLVLIMEDYATGAYEVELNMYIPTGGHGYYNLQKSSTPGEEWAFQADFPADGTAVIDAGGFGAANFEFAFDEWLNFLVIVDIDADWAEFYYNDELIIEYQWSLGTQGVPGLETLGGMNVFANGADALFYIDDLDVRPLNPMREPTGYDVYLDGALLASDLTVYQHQFADLVAEQEYTAGVVAVYDDGESDMAEYVFTALSSPVVPPNNLMGEIQDYNDVMLTWEAPGSENTEELVYDNGETTGAYSYVGYTMATQMSPSEACQILELKIHTSAGSEFNAEVWDWDTEPTEDLLYQGNITEVATDDWNIIDISAENLMVDGDFLVGFGSVASDTYMSYDGALDNGRSWDHADAGGWSTWSEAYLLRAVVQYGDGRIVELAPGSSQPVKTVSNTYVARNKVAIDVEDHNVDESSRILTGYNLYKDGEEIASVDEGTLEYLDAGLDAGTYQYYVTAMYDNGESDPSNLVEITVTLPAPENFNAVSQNGNVVCTWSAPSETRELTGYKIYRDDVEVGTATGTFFMDVAVPTGNYLYHATAMYDDMYESEASNQVELDHVDAGDSIVPLVTELTGNYPNPFNPTTKIKFALSEPGQVNVEIYNIKGEKVKTLVNGYREAAYYTEIWDGSDDNNNTVSSGVYFYKMKAGRYTSTKKMILMK